MFQVPLTALERLSQPVTALASADLALGQDCPRTSWLMRRNHYYRQTMGSRVMTTRWNTAPIIRTVQEFFSTYGRCREVTLADGPHHPVLLSIEQVPGDVPMPGPGAADSPGLRIRYRGHRQDLIALGCISRDMLASATRRRFDANPHGAVLWVESNAALGRWKTTEVLYFAQSRSFASMLPGVRTYCADWLEALTARPMLRLVVDNTHRQPGNPPASRELNRRSAAK